MIRAVIFDCFGVLYVDISHIYFARFPSHKEKLYEIDKQSELGFISHSDYLTAISDITGVDRKEVVHEFAKERVINQPLIDLIHGLKPHYKIALLSNMGRGWMDSFFTTHQLQGLFDAVVLSNEEGIVKPDPLIFERTAERLGVAPETCLMIDDNRANCDGAERVCMETLFYTAQTTPDDVKNRIEYPGKESA